MDRALFRPLLVTVAVAALPPGDPPPTTRFREKGDQAQPDDRHGRHGGRIIELLKDEAGTKKLLAAAVKMVKDEKPPPLNYNACYILAKAAQA